MMSLWLGLVLLLPGPALAQVKVCSLTGAVGLIDPCTRDGCTLPLSRDDACAMPPAEETPSCCSRDEEPALIVPADPVSPSVAVLDELDCCVTMDLGDGAPRAAGQSTLSESASSFAKLALGDLPASMVVPFRALTPGAHRLALANAQTLGAQPPPEAPLVLRV
jgi:hypothetical protein